MTKSNKPTETWKPVKGYEGLYLVSDKGRVKSLPRKYCNGKVLKNKIGKNGYPFVSLSKNGKANSFLVHRLVAIAFLPQVKEKIEVNHKDGIKDNNLLSNLEWCTSSENTKHSYKLGLQKKKPMSKDTKRKIKKAKLIRYYFTPFGVFDTIKEAALACGCGKTTIMRRCVNKKNLEYFYKERCEY